MERDNIYSFVKSCVSKFLPDEDIKIYEIADVSVSYIMYNIIINNEFKIELKLNRYDFYYDSVGIYDKIVKYIKGEINLYLNRYLKLKKINNIINEKTV